MSSNNIWKYLSIQFYILWIPIFACFFVGVPSIVVWGILLYICICSLFVVRGIIHALNEGNKKLATTIFILLLFGILIATFPIYIDVAYSFGYMIQHNIFLSYP